MSFSDLENSEQDGLPVEYYSFGYGNYGFYRYTNADRDLWFRDVEWKASAIRNPGISSGSSDGLELIVPSDLPLVALYRGVPPSTPVRLRVYRKHADASSDDDFRTVWIGTVTEVKRESWDSARIITSSAASTFTRNGLRLGWTRACPHSLYDSNCRIPRAAWGVTGLQIIGINGAEIAVNIPAGLPGDWFSGGLVLWDHDGLRERRGLKAQNGNVFGVLGGTRGLTMGMTVALYPGCDRTIATCEGKFNNRLNYGGVPQMPGISPYEIIKLF